MTSLDLSLPKADTIRRKGFFARAMANPGFLFGAILLGLIVTMAILAPLIAPYDPLAQNMLRRTVSPFWMSDGNWAHPLGTDGLGRDYLSRIIYGARISLLIGIFTVICSGIIGTVMGVLAGYFGGKVDLAINFLIMTRLTLPVVMVALAVVALFGGSLMVVVLVLGLLLWDRFAVVMRSAVMQIRNQEYIQAAQSMGYSTPKLLFRELLPNIFDRLAVIATFEMAHAILLEASLSFLGLGVQPPTPSWGLMVAEGRQYLLFDSWLILIPGAAICALVLAINMMGDGLRDAMAPDKRN